MSTPLPQDIADEISKLDMHCDVMEKEAGKEETLLNKARIQEIRNIRAQLKMLPENYTELFSPAEIRKIMNKLRERVRTLKFNPESAGEHSFMLKNE